MEEFIEITPIEQGDSLKRIPSDSVPPDIKNQLIKSYEETIKQIELEEEEKEQQLKYYDLTSYLKNVFDSNYRHFNEYIKPVLEDCLRRIRGKYKSSIQFLIEQQGGTDIYFPIASQLARIAEAWIIDILDQSSPTSRPWGIEPTPVSDIPKGLEERINEKLEKEIIEASQQGVKPSSIEIDERTNELYIEAHHEVQNVARKAIEMQEQLIDDALEEADFTKVLKEFIGLLLDYPTAFIGGPFYKKVFKNHWVNGKLEQYETLQEYYTAISPFDMFPAPNAKSLDDGDLVWLTRLSRKEISNLKGLEGVNEEAVDKVLQNFNSYGNWATVNIGETEREELEKRNPYNEKYVSTIEVLSFYCSIPISLLTDGIIPEGCLDSDVIEIEALMVGNELLRCVVVDTKKPYFKRPFYYSSYRKVPGSIWGEGVIQLAAETEDVCNSTIRSLINNLSIASGPQVAIDVTALPQGASLNTLKPWQIWQLNAVNTSGKPPIMFFQPQSNAGELLGVFNNFLNRGAEIVGIPWFLSGQNQKTGVASTAKGMAALVNMAGKSFKLCLSNVTEDILKPIVYQQFTANMLKNKGPTVYGDVKVIPMGFNALVIEGAKTEQTQEFAKLALQSPTVSELLGPEGINSLLKELGKLADIDLLLPSDDELQKKKAQASQKEKTPSKEELMFKIEQMKLQNDAQKAEARNQLQKERLELEKQKLELEKYKADLEASTKLAVQDEKNQGMIKSEVADSLGKLKLQNKEIQVKEAMGSGL